MFQIVAPETLPPEAPEMGPLIDLIVSKSFLLTIEMGMILPVTDGRATDIPETALVTDTAGVKIPGTLVSSHGKK